MYSYSVPLILRETRASEIVGTLCFVFFISYVLNCLRRAQQAVVYCIRLSAKPSVIHKPHCVIGHCSPDFRLTLPHLSRLLRKRSASRSYSINSLRNVPHIPTGDQSASFNVCLCVTAVDTIAIPEQALPRTQIQLNSRAEVRVLGWASTICLLQALGVAIVMP